MTSPPNLIGRSAISECLIQCLFPPTPEHPNILRSLMPTLELQTTCKMSLKELIRLVERHNELSRMREVFWDGTLCCRVDEGMALRHLAIDEDRNI
jgi:hypothetical protein